MSSSIFDLYTSSDAAKNILGGAGSGEGDIAKVNADVSDDVLKKAVEDQDYKVLGIQ